MTKPKEVQIPREKALHKTKAGRLKCIACEKTYKTYHGFRKHYNIQHSKGNNAIEQPGRPTAFTPEIIPRMIKYFSGNLVQVIDEEYVNKKGEKKTIAKIVPRELPTFEMFAHKEGTTAKTLWEWATHEESETKYPGFSNAYEHCKSLQKDFLVQNGLLGRYNSNVVRLVAINYSDMKDKTVQEHTGPEGGKIEVDAVLNKEQQEKLSELITKSFEEIYKPHADEKTG